MNLQLNSYIEAIRSRCPSFNGYVAGAAKWAEDKLASEEDPNYPAAYVVLESEQADANRGVNEYSQMVEVSIGVLVLVSNEDSDDQRGQTSLEAIDAIRDELFHAILRWSPDPKQFTPLEFDGSEVILLDTARMGYRFDFKFSYRLSYEDTWQAVEHAALKDFQITDLDLEADPVTLNGQILFDEGEKN